VSDPSPIDVTVTPAPVIDVEVLGGRGPQGLPGDGGGEPPDLTGYARLAVGQDWTAKQVFTGEVPTYTIDEVTGEGAPEMTALTEWSDQNGVVHRTIFAVKVEIADGVVSSGLIPAMHEIGLDGEPTGVMILSMFEFNQFGQAPGRSMKYAVVTDKRIVNIFSAQAMPIEVGKAQLMGQAATFGQALGAVRYKSGSELGGKWALVCEPGAYVTPDVGPFNQDGFEAQARVVALAGDPTFANELSFLEFLTQFRNANGDVFDQDALELAITVFRQTLGVFNEDCQIDTPAPVSGGEYPGGRIYSDIDPDSRSELNLNFGEPIELLYRYLFNVDGQWTKAWYFRTDHNGIDLNNGKDFYREDDESYWHYFIGRTGTDGPGSLSDPALPWRIGTNRGWLGVERVAARSIVITEGVESRVDKLHFDTADLQADGTVASSVIDGQVWNPEYRPGSTKIPVIDTSLLGAIAALAVQEVWIDASEFPVGEPGGDPDACIIPMADYVTDSTTVVDILLPESSENDVSAICDMTGLDFHPDIRVTAYTMDGVSQLAIKTRYPFFNISVAGGIKGEPVSAVLGYGNITGQKINGTLLSDILGDNYVWAGSRNSLSSTGVEYGLLHSDQTDAYVDAIAASVETDLGSPVDPDFVALCKAALADKLADGNQPVSENFAANKAGLGLESLLKIAMVQSVELDDTTAALDTKADLVDGVVPGAQMPGFVDDVIEVADFAALAGEIALSGKLYVTADDGKVYRWSGSMFVVIADSLVLGTTSSTAGRGDHTAAAYAHSQVTTGNPHNVTAAQAGALPATDGAVSLARLADQATATILGRTAGGSGPPAALTVAQVKTLLAYAASDFDLTGIYAPPGSGKYVSGGLYQTPCRIGGTRTFAAGTGVAFPVSIESPVTIDALAVHVTTGIGSATAFLYLVPADPTTGLPSLTLPILGASALVSVATTASYVVGALTAAAAVTRGTYWAVIHAVAGAPTYQAADSSTQFGPPFTRTNGASGNGLSCIPISGLGTSTTALTSLAGGTIGPHLNQGPIVSWRAA
jgi:hypothetical protein